MKPAHKGYVAVGLICALVAYNYFATPLWVWWHLVFPSGGTGRPAAVWRVELARGRAYYFAGGCCDSFNTLYDSMGSKICSPSGGATGHGDETCPVDLGEPLCSGLVWASESRYRGYTPNW